MCNKNLIKGVMFMDKNEKFNKIKYNAEYNAKNYKKMAITIKPDDYNTIDSFCKANGISKAKFIIAACKYCIDNDIDL